MQSGRLAFAMLAAGCAILACVPRAQGSQGSPGAVAGPTGSRGGARLSVYRPYRPMADTAVKSALVIPVQGVTADRLRDSFGDPRDASRRHGAIDIMAPRGTPVLAAAAATIVKRYNGDRGGIALYALAPDRRTIYYYAHLQRYEDGMVEGRRVEAGDVIGYVGDTGNAGAGNYHLHFEISTTSDPKRYWGGDPINPYPLLRAGITR